MDPWRDRPARHPAGLFARASEDVAAACGEHRPDALTLDLAMPGMDGIGVLRALKAGRARRVVVVSAFSPARGARAMDALAEGAFDLVPKPSFGESPDAVYGMPRAVAEAGLADEILPLDELAGAIVREAGR